MNEFKNKIYEFELTHEVSVGEVRKYLGVPFKGYSVVLSEIETDGPLLRETVFRILDSSKKGERSKILYIVDPHAGNFDYSAGLKTDHITITPKEGVPLLEKIVNQIQEGLENLS